MQMTTVLMIVHNQKELLIKSIESIRTACTEADALQVVVVDNASEDGTREWLEEQADIAYGEEETFREMWGELANEAIALFGIEGDILVMQAGVLVGADCIRLLKEGLYEEEHIAVTGPMMNGKHNNIEPCLFSGKNSRKVMELEPGIVMLRGDIFKECFDRKFADGYRSYQYTIFDYCYSVMKKRKMLSCIRNAVAIHIKDEHNNIPQILSEQSKLVDRWGMKYFNAHGNGMLVEMLEQKTEDKFSVLEIGCDCGATLLDIKTQFPNAEVYGYEINPNAADIARNFAAVEVGDVEAEQFPYEEGKFDYILFGDVLEHLHDPERVLTYCRSFLKESGCIVACIPNLQHISVIKQLLEGNFTYTDTGLLDKTHIHFFTYNEIVRMFRRAGYRVEATFSKSVPIGEEEETLKKQLMEIVKGSEELMFDTYQYVLRSKKES